LPHKQESIFLHEHNFDLEIVGIKSIQQEKWTEFFKIRTIAFAKLEELRQNKAINKNTQAIVTINFENKWNWSEKELAKMLNVAKVTIKTEPGLNIIVENGNLERCERCWNYFSSEEVDSDHICARCKEQIYEKK
jgi:isoleucyl-tRNA synthetase